jgi:hypothetical protein
VHDPPHARLDARPVEREHTVPMDGGRVVAAAVLQHARAVHDGADAAKPVAPVDGTAHGADIDLEPCRTRKLARCFRHPARDADDVVTPLQQAGGKLQSDEPRSPKDEDAHGLARSRMTGSNVPQRARVSPRSSKRARNVTGHRELCRRPARRRFPMRALCYHGKQDIRCDSVPDPRIEDPRDAIVRVTSCAICGSDLHLFNGFVPGMQSGDIMVVLKP